MPYFADLPPLEQERITCSIQAAVKYEIPANIMLAVAEKESGKPFLFVKNENGTFDVGVMQFNTAYLKTLKKHGIDARHVAIKGCYPYDLAAWRITNHIENDKGDIYQKVSNYHSYTPYYNEIYKRDLVIKAKKWSKWLKRNFKNIVIKK